MFLMSRHYTLLAVMLVMTVTHPIVRYPTDVGVRQLLVKPGPGLHCNTPTGVAICGATYRYSMACL